MPQIPLFEQSQRLEPSAPVAAVSTDDARLGGNATQVMGKTLFEFGNKLDELGKAAKVQDDKYTVKARLAQFERAALELKARQDAAPIIKDDETGFGGAKKLGDDLDELRKQFTDSMPSKAAQQMFAAESEESIYKFQSVALAGEIKKREENIPILRQQMLGEWGALSRKDHRYAAFAMGNWEEAILNDKGYAPAQKAKAIADGKAAIAAETIYGMMEMAEQNSLANGGGGVAQAFETTERTLEEKFAGVLTSEQKESLKQKIVKARDDYFTLNWKIVTQQEHMAKKEIDERDQKAEDMFLKAKQDAGADQATITMLDQKIMLDKNLKPETKKMLREMPLFSETQNDKYEVKFAEKLYSNKSTKQSLFNDLRVGYATGQITIERYRQLQKDVSEKQSQTEKNPNLTQLVSAAENTIKAHYGVNIFDPETTLYKSESGKKAAKALYEFRQQLTPLYANGTIGNDSIERVRSGIIQGRGFFEEKNVTGAPLSGASSPQDARKIRDSLAAQKRDPKVWSTKTPEQKKLWIKDFQNSEYNYKGLKSAEGNKIQNFTPKSNKVQGDE